MSEGFANYLDVHKTKFAVLALFLLGIFLLAFGVGMFFLKGSGGDDDIRILDSQGSSSGKIVVHVDGAVKTPGVYELNTDSRVNDLVALAGGLSDDANSAQINLAAKLSDGQKVYLPKIGESASAGIVAGESASGLVNVNSASEAQLDALPGVGPVTAGKIIDGRPYSSIEELLSKKAVGSATFGKIKDLVTAY